MSYPIKLASIAVPLLFLLIDSADSKTGKTGVVPTVTISKNGGAFGAPAGVVAEVGAGWYKLTPTAEDTGTPGILTLHATGAGCDPTDAHFTIVAYDPLNATSLGLGHLDAAVSSRNAVAPDNASVAAILAKTDVATSTRMATFVYTAPDNVGIANMLTQATAANATAGVIKSVTDQLATALEAASGGNFRFTVSALANGPGGSGGLTEAQDAILRDMGAKLVGDADRTASGDVYKDGEGVARLQVAFPTKSARRVTHL